MTAIHIPDHETDPFTYLMPSVELTASPLITDVTAEEYLRYAARDLEDGSGRGSMNALGNAKRALHLTVESLLNAYGLLVRNTRTSFPKKLELLDASGLFSLSILNKLNLERNAMEHEYRIPAEGRAQEVIDVVRLLLLATRRMGEYVPYECLAGWRADQTLGVVQLDPSRGYLSFFKATGPTQVFEYEGKVLTLLEPIRTSGGDLIPGVDIDPSPVWTVSLDYNNRDDWRPLLRPLVQLTDIQYAVDPAIVQDGAIQASMRITLPRYQQAQVRNTMRDKGTPVINYSNFAFGFDRDSA